MSHDELLAEALAQVAELRATLTEQREEMSALRAEMRRLQAGQAVTAPASEIAAAPPTVSGDSAVPLRTPGKAKRGTSRRGLLRGAATATAAAAVAAVAVGGAEQAHAAPEATGSDVILGQSNDANATTTLTNTSGAAVTPLLQLTLAEPVVITDTTDTTALLVSATSTSGTGASFNNAITATATTGNAIVAQANGYPNSAVMATVTNGFATSAIFGSITNSLASPVPRKALPLGGVPPYFSTGIQGNSDIGIGIAGFSSVDADLAAWGTGVIWHQPQTQAGPPTSLSGPRVGFTICDANGDLWLLGGFDTGITPDWRKVALLAPGATGGATSYLSKPIRLLDTRASYTDANQHPGTPCTSTTPTTVNVAGITYNSVSVYAGAVGAIGNVTVLNAAGGGYLEIVPSGAGFTGAANLAFAPGQIISNAFNVGLASGNLDIVIGGANVDVIVDLFAIVA